MSKHDISWLLSIYVIAVSCTQRKGSRGLDLSVSFEAISVPANCTIEFLESLLILRFKVKRADPDMFALSKMELILFS